VLPTIGIDPSDKGYAFATHPPTTPVPVVVGVLLIAVSIAGFWLAQRQWASDATVGAGLDLSRVMEGDGVLWTMVAGCEIRVVNAAPGHRESRATDGRVPCLSGAASCRHAYLESICRSADGTLNPRATRRRTEWRRISA
jgi:hypothetical protein